MHIHCEKCGTAIPGTSINIQEKLAVCPHCGSVFSFADHLADLTPRRKAKPPESLSVTETTNALEIRYRWLTILKSEEHWFTVLCGFGVVVLGRLAYAMVDGLDTILEGALAVGFAVAALVCLYLLLVVLFDRVSITVDHSTVRVKHKPLPFTDNNVARADVVRVDCTVASYNEDNPKSEFVDYDVRLLRHDGHKVTVATLRRDVAFYVAQVIEDYLFGDNGLTGDDQDTDEELMLLHETGENATGSAHAS